MYNAMIQIIADGGQCRVRGEISNGNCDLIAEINSEISNETYDALMAGTVEPDDYLPPQWVAVDGWEHDREYRHASVGKR